MRMRMRMRMRMMMMMMMMITNIISSTSNIYIFLPHAFDHDDMFVHVDIW